MQPLLQLKRIDKASPCVKVIFSIVLSVYLIKFHGIGKGKRCWKIYHDKVLTGIYKKLIIIE